MYVHHGSQSACGQAPNWFPVNILKGGKQMDSVITQMQTGWGKALYQKFLIRQVATSLYRCPLCMSQGVHCQLWLDHSVPRGYGLAHCLQLIYI